jgi:CheY-like chemotaxis protein
MGRHALIIEDEILIALELEGLLHDVGFETCDIAMSCEEALASATAHRPDLVTADMRIIGGTGLEAVESIETALGRLPVVYVTGNPDMLRAQNAKIVVDKPLNVGAFNAACTQACASI